MQKDALNGGTLQGRISLLSEQTRFDKSLKIGDRMDVLSRDLAIVSQTLQRDFKALKKKWTFGSEKDKEIATKVEAHLNNLSRKQKGVRDKRAFGSKSIDEKMQEAKDVLGFAQDLLDGLLQLDLKARLGQL